MTDKHVNENVEIALLPGETNKTYSAEDRSRIDKIIRDNLLLSSSEPYHKVQVEVNGLPDGSPESLVATLLRAKTYTADIVKINVDKNYNVKSIERM